MWTYFLPVLLLDLLVWLSDSRGPISFSMRSTILNIADTSWLPPWKPPSSRLSKALRNACMGWVKWERWDLCIKMMFEYKHLFEHSCFNLLHYLMYARLFNIHDLAYPCEKEVLFSKNVKFKRISLSANWMFSDI